MSVMALRSLMWSSGTDSAADLQQLSTLRNFKSLLQKALDRSPKQGKKIYEETIVLVQVLVNTALGNYAAGSASRPLACQAATVVLSMVSSFRDLIPDLDNLTETDQKYVDGLLPDVMAIKSSLNRAHVMVISSLGPNQLVDNIFTNRLSRHSKELQTVFEAFEMRISFFLADPEVSSRRKGGALRNNGDGFDLTWDDIELKQALQGTEARVWRDGGRTHASTNTFWDNTFEAEVRGKVAVVKTYSTHEKFALDLETMKARRHPNLPSLFGHSTSTMSTPFVVLSIESFTPFWEYLPIACSQAPDTAIEDTWRMLVSMRSATKYLLTRLVLGDLADDHQTTLENDLTDCVEAAVVDPTGKVIISPDFLQPRLGATKRVDPVEYLSITRAVPNKVIESFFSIPMPGSGSAGGSIDRLPSLLRPLRWAVIDNPTDLLHSSPARLKDDRFVKSAILAHRPDPSMRNQLWPAWGDDSKWTVGDVGRFFISTDGSIAFEYYCNIQRELGGYSRNDDLVSNPVFVRYTLSVPPGIALEVFSRVAPSIAKRRRIHPTELVLITQTTHAATNRSAAVNPLPKVEPFDTDGRLFPSHWLSSPQEQFDTKEPRGLRYTVDHRFVQIEQDELEGSPSEYPGFLRPANIGDVGYYVKEFDGGISFQVVCSSGSAEIAYYAFKAWRGNESVDLGDGIWRSPVITAQDPNVILSWNVVAWTGLSPHLEELYLFRLASTEGNIPLKPENARKLQMIDDIDIQIRGSLNSSSVFDYPPLWIFVHFDSQCRPVRTYFSQYDTPDVVPSVSPPWDGVGGDISIITNRNHSHYGLEQAGSPRNFYKKVEVRQVDPLPPQLPRNTKVGDLGYFVSGSDEWCMLGNVGLLSSSRRISHLLGDANTWECTRLSNHLWRIRFQIPESPISNPDQIVHLNVQWAEDLRSTCLSEFPWVSDYCMSLQNDTPPINIKIITRIAVDVEAYAPEDMLRRNVPVALFVAFPPEGGCYAYWSPDDHTSINERVLSKLEIESWQPAGCSVRVSTTFKHETLEEVLLLMRRQRWMSVFEFRPVIGVQVLILVVTCSAVIVAVYAGYYGRG